MSQNKEGPVWGDEAAAQNQPDPAQGTTNADSQAQADATQTLQEGEQQEQTQPAEPKRANVILARDQKPVTVDGPINIGMTTVDMPDEEAQRAGFYLDPAKAALILAQYPRIYKTALNVGKSQQAPQQDAGQQTPAAEEGVTTDGDTQK